MRHRRGRRAGHSGVTGRKGPFRDREDSWDKYWRRAERSSAFGNQQGEHPAITAFWGRFFSQVRSDIRSPLCIDLASGSGAVLDAAKATYDGELPAFLCVDLSQQALEGVKSRHPDVDVLLADAGRVPLADSCCDVVTSQFGIEYAGRRSVAEMARLVRSGGHFGAILHHRGGVVFENSTRNLEAIRKLIDCRFLPQAKRILEAGFAALSGGPRLPYEAAAQDFQSAVNSVEAILDEFGTDVADSLLTRLYGDVANLHENLQAYRAHEVMRWLDDMQGEVESYAARTEAMLEAAIDADDFGRISAVLKAKGLRLAVAEPLMDPDRDLPLAWSVHGLSMA